MSQATHARFLQRHADARAAVLDRVLCRCRVCGSDITRRRMNAGEAYPLGPGVSICRGCDSDEI